MSERAFRECDADHDILVDIRILDDIFSECYVSIRSYAVFDQELAFPFCERISCHHFEIGYIYRSRIFVPEIFYLISFRKYILIFDDARVEDLERIPCNGILEDAECEIRAFGDESRASRSRLSSTVSDELASPDDISRFHNAFVEILVYGHISVRMYDHHPVDADGIAIRYEIDDTVACCIYRRLLLRLDLYADARYAITFLICCVSEIRLDLFYRVDRPR